MNIDKQIEKKESELKTLKEKKEIEKNKVDFIVIDGWAYETKEHHFNEKLGDIKIPKGKELWLPSEVCKFYEDKKLKEKLNLSECYFFVKQMRANTSDVARFGAGSVRAILGFHRGPSGRVSVLGVRWVRSIKGEKK